MTTLQWVVESMEVKPSVDTYSNVVCSVSWRLTATDEATGSDYSISGKAGIDLDPNIEFIPYENLTEAEALDWVKATMNDAVDVFEAEVARRLLESITPVVVSLPLPWVQ